MNLIESASMVSKIDFPNAKIMFTNFSGRPTKYYDDGRRTFCLVLDSVQAKKLSDEGYRVKKYIPRNAPDTPIYYVEVTVSYRFVGPKIGVVYTNRPTRITYLSEDDVSLLDGENYDRVDLRIKGSNWQDSSGQWHKKAYLDSMRVILSPPPFFEGYENDDVQEDSGTEEMPF